MTNRQKLSLLVLTAILAAVVVRPKADNFSIATLPGQTAIANGSTSTNQNVGTYTIFTASTAAVVVEYCTFEVTTTVTGLTSVTVQTDDTTPTVMLASVVVAALTGGKPLTTYNTPTYLPSGKHIQLSIVGTNGTAGAIQATCKYSPAATGGLLS